MTNKIDVALMPTAFEVGRYAAPIVVVIDILRASTTIVTALASGAKSGQMVGSYYQYYEYYYATENRDKMDLLLIKNRHFF